MTDTSIIITRQVHQHIACRRQILASCRRHHSCCHPYPTLPLPLPLPLPYHPPSPSVTAAPRSGFANQIIPPPPPPPVLAKPLGKDVDWRASWRTQSKGRLSWLPAKGRRYLLLKRPLCKWAAAHGRPKPS